MSIKHVTKTEHNGAKNGGGYRGRRVEAKQFSKKLRRAGDALAIAEQCQTATRIGRDRWGRAGWLVWVDGRIIARGLATRAEAHARLTAALGERGA